MNQELTYWVALSETPTIWTSRKNEMIVYCFKQGKTIIDFFESDNFLNMDLKPEEITLLRQKTTELGNYSFMVEELLNQGYEIIPVTSKDYSQTLKSNLKYNSPLILYVKGNKQILQEPSIAIVGSRNANDNSLLFTDNVAKKAVAEQKIVVSGFAKGVDKQALESALKYKGKSVIVLPQGITTFSSGMKKYYKQIISGDVLVLSTFPPKAAWSVGLAMSRNAIIYGLASEIYAAQSDEKGGTWSGVCDGLKKNRTVYVRVPSKNEKCANLKLIEMGAKPVDIEGNPIQETVTSEQPSKSNLADTTSNLIDTVLGLLKNGGEYKLKDIKTRLNLSISDNELRKILNKPDVFQKNKKGNTNFYSLKNNNPQKSLFGNE